MKICKKCGFQGESEKFCPRCGEALEEQQEVVIETVEEPLERVEAEIVETPVSLEAAEAQPVFEEAPGQEQTEEEEAKEEEKEEKKKSFLKDGRKLKAAAVIIIVVTAIITLIRVFVGGKAEGFDTIGKDVISVQQQDKRLLIFTAEGKTVEGPECEYFSVCNYSLDGARVLVLADGDTLYLLDKEGFTEIDSDVYAATLSITGAGLAYIKDYNEGYGDLYLYNVKKAKGTKVESEVICHGFVISPDGKSVAFLGDNERCYLYLDGKLKSDGIKSAKPLAIADDGKYFYYGKNDNLYVLAKKSGDADKLASGVREVVFNRDFSQMMYSYDGRTYYCSNGKEAEDTITTKGSCSVVLPENANSLTVECPIYDYGSVTAIVLGKATLSNLVCRLDGGLYYITDGMVAEKIVSGYDAVKVASNGDTLVYYKGDNLYKVKSLKNSLDAAEIADDLSMTSIRAIADLSKIYFYDDEEEEIRVFDGKKVTKLYDDSYEGMYVIGKNLYFMTDYDSSTGGTICVSKNGGKKQDLSSSEEVKGCFVSNNRFYYYTEDKLYVADGTKEKLLIENYIH